MLDICERKPGTRTYNPPIELIWNTALGTSSLSLRQAISQKIDVGVDVMMIAKHQVQRFEWTVIEDKVKVRMLRIACLNCLTLISFNFSWAWQGYIVSCSNINEPVHEKTNNLGSYQF